jgi:hypothetical protein
MVALEVSGRIGRVMPVFYGIPEGEWFLPNGGSPRSISEHSVDCYTQTVVDGFARRVNESPDRYVGARSRWRFRSGRPAFEHFTKLTWLFRLTAV